MSQAHTKAGTCSGAVAAQQAPTIEITPAEALAVVRAYQRLQRLDVLLCQAMPGDIHRGLSAVIDRAGLSALVA